MNVNELKALNKMTSDEIDEGQLIKVYRRKRSNSLPIVPFFQDLLSFVGIYDTKSSENEAFPELHESLYVASNSITLHKALQFDAEKRIQRPPLRQKTCTSMTPKIKKN